MNEDPQQIENPIRKMVERLDNKWFDFPLSLREVNIELKQKTTLTSTYLRMKMDNSIQFASGNKFKVYIELKLLKN